MSDLASQDQAIVAVGYVRVSTEEQVREGYSLDEQKREIRAHAERHGWTLARIYADEGLSGRRADRPGFRRMLDDAGNGSFQRAIAWKLDRLGRSTRLVLESLGALDAAGVEFVSLRESLDTSSPAGRYMRTNLAAIAEMEAEMIAERTRTGIAGRKRDGRRGGGPPPYGFDYTRDRDDPTDKGTLTPNPLEAAIVTEIHRLYLDGFGISKIVRHLRARNERTKREAQWSNYQVGFILDSPLYAGYIDIDPEGEPIKARHDPIVSHADWLAVRAIRKARRQASGRGRGRTTLTPHLLTRGLGRCGKCGAALIPRGQRYVCRSRHHYGSCDLPTIPRQQIDQTLLDEFEQRILDLDATRERIQQAASQVRDEALAQRRRAERDVADAHEAVGRIDRAYREGMPEHRYERQIAEAEADLDAAAAELDRLNTNADEIEAALAAAATVDAHSESLRALQELRDAVAGRLASDQPIEALRETLRTIFYEITVHTDDPTDELWLVPSIREDALLGFEVRHGARLDEATFEDESPWRQPLYVRVPVAAPIAGNLPVP